MNKFLKNKILLNSGRNCLRLAVKSLKIKTIQIPYYICPAVWKCLKQENVSLKFYHIDKNFLPYEVLDNSEFILYPNYFGISSHQTEFMAKKYDKLISDNAHAFFAKAYGIASFYSPRKFFNVLNGGILYFQDKNLYKNQENQFQTDTENFSKIIDFESFCKNELLIDNQPIKFMCKTTKFALEKFNLKYQKKKKLKIFKTIYRQLQSKNEISINLREEDVPMCYPFLSKDLDYMKYIAKKIENNGIYILKYAYNMPSEYPEHDLSNIMMIPLIRKMNSFNL
jgi:hypothetical protein